MHPANAMTNVLIAWSADHRVVGTAIDLLREMVREAERLVDHQLQAMEELDNKSEQMIKLSVALLAGGAALAGFTIRHLVAYAGGAFLAALGVAATLNGTAIVSFVASYVGLRHQTDAHVGPHPRWLKQKPVDEGWTLALHVGSLIQGYADYSDHNVGRMRTSARRRVRGLALLAAALIGYASAVVSIAARTIP
jgi:hypothetical protein